MTNIKTFTALQDLLGKEQAAAVAQYVDENMNLSELATKSDLAILRKDIDLVRKDLDSTKIELKKDIDLVRKDIDLVRLEFKKDIEMGFKDQLKWLIILMFGFSSLILAVIKLL